MRVVQKADCLVAPRAARTAECWVGPLAVHSALQMVAQRAEL